MTRPIVGRNLLAIVVALGMTAACSGAAEEASGDVDSFEVSTSQLYVTVSNRTGSSLLDVKIEVEPVGSATVFSSTYPRMEPGERRNFPVQEFRGEDGTPLNLRVHRPRMVSVSARNQNDEQFAMRTPWQ